MSKPLSAKVDSLSLPDPIGEGRNDRLVYESLLGDVNSSHQVSVRGKSADLADKRGLIMAIRFRDKATSRAGLGCVSGVNQFYQHPCQFSLVGYKLAELGECPRLMSMPLAMANRSPRANALQILKGDSPLRVFSLRHKPFADKMVGISSKSGLSTRQSFEMLFSRLRSLTLKGSLELVGLLSNIVYLLARVKLTVAVNSNMDNAEVNPQSPDGVVWGRFWSINGEGEIEDALTEQKVALPDNPINSGFLISPNPNRDNLATLQSKDRDLVQALPRQNALVIDHSTAELEGMQLGLISAITFNHLTNNPHCHLRRKPVVFSKVAVSKMVKFYLAGSAILKGKVGDIVTSLVKPFHSLKQSLMLLRARRQFNHQSLFHSCIIDYNRLYVKFFERGMGGFLCQINQATSTTRFL